MRIKIVATDQLIAFSKPPVFNYSLAPTGSNLQVEVGGMFNISNSSSNCFNIDSNTQNGYSFNSEAKPFEVIAESSQGERLFRGFFDEYTTRYDKENTTSTLVFNDCSRFLNRRPIFGKFRNTFQAVLEEIVSNSGAEEFISPIIYNTSTTKALKAVKKITFVTLPIEGDIIIVGKRRYKYVLESPTEFELNIESDFGFLVNELTTKINSSSDSECTANEDGMSVMLSGLDFNNNFLVYTDGTRVTNTVIQDASSSDENGIVTNLLELHVNIEFQGEYLRECLEKLCQIGLCNFYIDPKFGNLVIYQQQYYLDNLNSLRTLDISPGVVQCLDDEIGIIENLSYNESGSSVNKVIVWGRNGEVPLPDLRLEDQHTTISEIDNIRRDIPANFQGTDYFYNENAVRVVQVKITPKEPVPPDEEVCYSIPVTLDSSDGFDGDNDTITVGSNLFNASSQSVSVTPSVEIEKYAIFDLDLTDIPQENSKSNYIKLTGAISFPYDSDDFGETFEAEVDFYLYTPTEVVLLEKVRTHTIAQSDYANILVGETIVYLNDYKGSEISIKAVARLITSLTTTASFLLNGKIKCLSCDAIPVNLNTNNDQMSAGSTLINDFSSFCIAGRIFDGTLGSVYTASRSGSANFKIDLTDSQYFSGDPYIKISGLLDGFFGIGTIHLETSILINSVEVFNREINSNTSDAYEANIYIGDLLGTVVDMVINQTASTGDDSTIKTVTAQALGTVVCLLPGECIDTEWTATGIFNKLTPVGTRNGFRVNASDLDSSASGTFITNINLPPEEENTYSVSFAVDFNFSADSAQSGGLIIAKINGITTNIIEIIIGNNGARVFTVNLSAYNNQTVELLFEYDGSSISTISSEGYVDIYPISICPNPQNVLPADSFGNYILNLIGETSGGSASGMFNHDVQLINPITSFPVLCTFIGNITNVIGSAEVKVYVNEMLFLSLSASSLTTFLGIGGEYGGIIIFDSSMSGNNINIRIEATANNPDGFPQVLFEGAIYYL